MNRAERRAAERAAAKAMPAICPSGQHAYRKITATLKGEAVAARVVCQRCRRTIEQVMEAQPDELEKYRAWLKADLVRDRQE